MSYIECENGHLYDPVQYSSCPHCKGENNVIDFTEGTYVNNPQKTVSPLNYDSVSRGISVSDDTVIGVEVTKGPGKTVAPIGSGRRKTISAFKMRYDFEPVVGWLACIEGADKGKSYQIFAKNNMIGRGSDADICIEGDMSVSEKHARLAYEYKHNSFHLIPGESSNDVYLNDEPIYIPARLEAFDIIELGASKLIFVPLCCEHFKWETKEKSEETV